MHCNLLTFSCSSSTCCLSDSTSARLVQVELPSSFTQECELQMLQPSTWTAASLTRSSVWMATSTHPRLAWLGRWFLAAAEHSTCLISTTILPRISEHCLISPDNSLEISRCLVGSHKLQESRETFKASV